MVERASQAVRQHVYKNNSAKYDEPKLYDRLKGTFEGTTFILAVLGFLIGRVSIVSTVSPFGAAFLVSVALLMKSQNTAVIGTSIIIGLLTKVNGTATIQSIISIMLVFLATKALKFNDKTRTIIAASAALAVNFAVAMISNVLINGTFILYDTLVGMFNSTIVMALVYIFNYSIPIIIDRKRRSILSNEEIICFAILCGIVISGLSDIFIYGISVKVVLSVLIIALTAYGQGAGVGASIGTTIGLITCISSNQAPLAIGTYALCGMLSGIFKDMGKAGVILGFIMADVSMMFYLGAEAAVIDFREVALGLILFIVFPASIIDKVMPFIDVTAKSYLEQQSYVERMKDIIQAKLNHSIEVFNQLSKTLEENESTNKLRQKGEVNAIINSIVDKVCPDCGARNICWGRDLYRTYQNMFEMLDVIECDGKVDMGNLPLDLKCKCLKAGLLIKTANYMYDLYRMNYKWRIKAQEGKKVVGEQLQGVVGILKGLSKEIREEVSFKGDVEEELAVALDKEGVNFSDIAVVRDESGRYQVSMYRNACLGRRECIKDISPLVSKILNKRMKRDMASCMIKEGTNLCYFKLVEAVKFQVSTGVAKSAKEEGELSGDNYSFIELDDGKYMLALSDGMGTGPVAAAESNAAITLLEKYLEAGFDKAVALKAINSAMSLRSPEDNFATIDLAVADLYTGKVEMIKIGAASTFIKRADGSIETVNSTSLPIGILNNVDIDSTIVNLSHGDMIIMITDGVEDAGEGGSKWVLKALEEIESRNPQQVAEELLAKAKGKCEGKLADDMSVLVSKMWQVA